MNTANPTGIPRLDREEPELASEEDIPTESSDKDLEPVRPAEPSPERR